MPTDKRDQITLCNPAHLQKEGYDFINLPAQPLYTKSVISGGFDGRIAFRLPEPTVDTYHAYVAAYYYSDAY